RGLDPVTRAVVLAGRPTGLGTDVRAGTSLVKTLTITAPPLAGVFLLRFDLAPLGGVPLSLQGSAPADVIVNVSAGYGATYSPAAVGASLVAGAQSTLSVSVKNTGIRTWADSGTNPVHSALLLYDGLGNTVSWDGARTVLASDVQPGATVTLSLVVDAPLRPGIYRARPDLVQEGVAWFGALGSPTAAYTLVAVLPDYRGTLSSGPLTVSRANPVAQVTVTNTSSALWTAAGVAPGQLSVHWLDPQGTMRL